MSEKAKPIAVGLRDAAEIVGLSKRTLEYAVSDPDPARHLKTVRACGRRLVRLEDLQNWFDRVASDEQ